MSRILYIVNSGHEVRRAQANSKRARNGPDFQANLLWAFSSSLVLYKKEELASDMDLEDSDGDDPRHLIIRKHFQRQC